jgi:penicillin-binding protein 1C
MNRITGYLSAAEIARRILTFIHGDQLGGLDDVSFPPPRGWRAARVCALTGLQATDRCDRVFLEWFPRGAEPVEACAAHVAVAVDRATGRPATGATPASRVQERLYASLDRRYARWADDAGIPTLPDGAGPAPIGTVPRVRITSPENGALLIRDPETPEPMATLELAATVSPAARQVLWSVDGRPFTLSDYPAPARWPLRPGPHVIEARVPFTRLSSRVRVEVR